MSEQGHHDGDSAVQVDRIVVGVDGGPAAAAAVRWAAGQSFLTGLPLHAVHSWQSRRLHLSDVDTPYRRAATADARAQATRWVVAALGGQEATLRWTLGIVEGAPGPALVAQSRQAVLVVVGTGEHVGLGSVVVGSVSRYVLAHAHSPIVAVQANQVSHNHGDQLRGEVGLRRREWLPAP